MRLIDADKTIFIYEANENCKYCCSDCDKAIMGCEKYYKEKCLADKKLFVKNLGWLLSQTSEDIKRAYLNDKEDVVKITYGNGFEKKIKVDFENSYLGIIKEVVENIH